MTSYREWRPAGPVGTLLECAWQSRTGPEVAREQRVLPDGCMDLLVLDGRLVVAGPDTAAHTARPSPGAVTTGLRFRPGVLPTLLGVPAAELVNQRVSLSDLPLSPADVDVTVVGEAPDDRGVHLDAALLLDTASRLVAADRRRPLPRPLPRWALRALARGAATTDVADRLGVTTRTLHRTCVATLGYGPSVARRVLRFRAAAALLYSGAAPADVAARTGYADQPHLSREVRALAGVSPTALAAG
ncbi:helix-turn-helix domain-containing protein [Pseudonocardia endophytica]|uniref:AraC-like DNA-binding protein n=1 Tax=Pseudonocardia endophytica TaxID=401976 RepID=A0A4R1HQ75_PSEEN|nr:helix-turn-helix domain-containing protein [Pseudonocardia endophytica]TCK24258.1 AraC-like DNA-binding protein [Pseudonocardia endophytica]